MENESIEFTLKSGAVIDIEVNYNVTPYVSARTECLPEDSSPAEGGEIEIESIMQQSEEHGESEIHLEDSAMFSKEFLAELLMFAAEKDLPKYVIRKLEKAHAKSLGYTSEMSRLMTALERIVYTEEAA